jgi:hypothetical protein
MRSRQKLGLATAGLLVTSLGVVTVADHSGWWCRRQAAGHVDRMRALGDAAFADAADTSKSTISCINNAGPQGAAVSYELLTLTRPDVTKRLLAHGWTNTDGHGWISPDGQYAIQYPLARDAQHPKPYIDVTIYSPTLGDGDWFPGF